ncbi:MAG: hypothetical protein ABJB61_00795 [bacterium]
MPLQTGRPPAVKRYHGRGIIWEIYNEPNTGFWTPAPNVSDYVKLALATSKAVHDVAPAEQIIGPGVWGFDLEFIEQCLRTGLLNYCRQNEVRAGQGQAQSLSTRVQVVSARWPSLATGVAKH